MGRRNGGRLFGHVSSSSDLSSPSPPPPEIPSKVSNFHFPFSRPAAAFSQISTLQERLTPRNMVR